jgi:DNA polymerase-1
VGSALEAPAALFGAAWRAGRVAELDWACRAAAFTEAARGGLAPPLTLFVNAEPVSLGVACPDDLRPAIELSTGRLRVVVEVTERAVAGDPARLLATVAQAREAGWGVALDDVGAAPASLAVLPFVRPDVIKLDLRLLQGRTTAEAAHINAVRAQAERTDAVVIAEGIETIKHAREAVAAGATTPWEVVTAVRAPRSATRDLVAEMCMQLEHQGLDAAGPNLLLACFQEAGDFTPASRSRYEFLATRAVFCGALGHGMPVAPVAGVRGADLAAADPLRGEWDLIVIGPRFAAALAAKDLGDGVPTASGVTRWPSPTTATWSSAPPSRCCAASSPTADRQAVAGSGQTSGMRVAVVEDAEGGGLLQAVAEDGTAQGPVEQAADLAAAVAERERAGRPRWVWAATGDLYPGLLSAGVRVGRCHDLGLTEQLLLAADGRWGEPRSFPAAWARLRGLPVPGDRAPGLARAGQPALFDHTLLGLPGAADLLEGVVAVHADQQHRLAGGATRPPGPPRSTGRPAGLGLLVAAESAGALAGAEMAAAGLPWRPEVHDAVLTELLGARPRAGSVPPRLADLAARIGAAFGGQPLNPDSPAQLLRAFAAAGLPLSSTRSHVLRGVDHPAVPLLLAYKELSRLHAAHGWAWLDAWVAGGRFRPEYVPGGVVSGRWATRGGGALQIPHALRRAVVADPGWTLVVADASQLEPRVLAALSGDQGLARAAASGDLYAALAADAFGGDRARAKTALLAAMYGGDVGPLMSVLRRRFPAAVGYVEAAARAGEEGGLVRSRLGRTCPSPSAGWLAATDRAAGADPDSDAGAGARARRAARDRGRFTRNFVVQASAADWALVLLAAVRRRLATPGPPDRPAGPHLVFFQHDEVVVHCPKETAEEVAATVRDAADESRRLVFDDTAVRFPLSVAVVDCYADAK